MFEEQRDKKNNIAKIPDVNDPDAIEDGRKDFGPDAEGREDFDTDAIEEGRKDFAPDAEGRDDFDPDAEGREVFDPNADGRKDFDPDAERRENVDSDAEEHDDLDRDAEGHDDLDRDAEGHEDFDEELTDFLMKRAVELRKWKAVEVLKAKHQFVLEKQRIENAVAVEEMIDFHADAKKIIERKMREVEKKLADQFDMCSVQQKPQTSKQGAPVKKGDQGVNVKQGTMPTVNWARRAGASSAAAAASAPAMVANLSKFPPLPSPGPQSKVTKPDLQPKPKPPMLKPQFQSPPKPIIQRSAHVKLVFGVPTPGGRIQCAYFTAGMCTKEDCTFGHCKQTAEQVLANLANQASESINPASESINPKNNRKFKTVLCDYYENSGSCRNGNFCDFAHGFYELR